jgi:cell pole-organizing protein PopZ
MTDDRRQQEPTMEEILASIRRIISEDNRPAPDTAPAAAADSAATPADTLGEPAASRAPETTAPAFLVRPTAAPSLAADADSPLDLTLALPPAPDRPPVSPLLSGDTEPVLDLTNEVQDTASARAMPTPERPAYLSREAYRDEEREFQRQAQPLPAAPIEEPFERLERSTPAEEEIATDDPVIAVARDSGPSTAPASAGGLLSASTEAATVSALSRLRQAAARPQGPTPEQIAEAVRAQVASLLDDRFAPALDEALPVALAERLPAAIREQVGPLLRERTDPLLRDEIAGALDRRLDPLLREQATSLLRDRADSVLQDEVAASVAARVEPLMNERFGPALNDRLEPLVAARIEPLLRERLDPLLREWLDRNLPAIVERVVEREIERLVRQPGAN